MCFRYFVLGNYNVFFYISSNSCQFIRRDKLNDLLWTHSLKVCVIPFNLVFSSHIRFFFPALLYFNDSRQLFVDYMHQCIQLYCIYYGWQGKKHGKKIEKTKQLKQETRRSFEKQTSSKAKWLCRAPRHRQTNNKILNWKIDKADTGSSEKKTANNFQNQISFDILCHLVVISFSSSFHFVRLLNLNWMNFFPFDATSFLWKWSFHFGWVMWTQNNFHSELGFINAVFFGALFRCDFFSSH